MTGWRTRTCSAPRSRGTASPTGPSCSPATPPGSRPPPCSASVARTSRPDAPLQLDGRSDLLEAFDPEADELVQRQPEVRLGLTDLPAVHARSERLLLQLLLDRRDLHAT